MAHVAQIEAQLHDQRFETVKQESKAWDEKPMSVMGRNLRIITERKTIFYKIVNK